MCVCVFVCVLRNRYAGAALKLDIEAGRGAYVSNITWRNIIVEESGGLFWLTADNRTATVYTRIDGVTLSNVTLQKLSCRYVYSFCC